MDDGRVLDVAGLVEVRGEVEASLRRETAGEGDVDVEDVRAELRAKLGPDGQVVLPQHRITGLKRPRSEAA